jgi:tripartite-type tricarboxylate transporter receptor subunit TctC
MNPWLSFGRIVLVLPLALLFGIAGKASAASFYEGKIIRFVVGSPPGGGYDTYTRTVARHMKKHIPGNPTIAVENMPGAGTLVAANYTYNQAKPDGLTVGIWNGAFVLRQALGDRGVRIDGRKVGWIGAPSKGTPICAVMGFSGLKNLSDVLESKRSIRLGSTRAGSPYDDVPRILNKVLGTKFEVISGYPGTSDVRLALQKREVEGACWTWESMRVSARALLDAQGEEKLFPYLIHRKFEDPEVKDLPLFSEVIKGEENRATYDAWAATYEFMRPFSLPPATPAGRLNMLRQAFEATIKDPAFRAEATKIKLDLDYVSPKEIEAHVDRILSMSERVKENLGFLVRKSKKN